MSISKHVYYTDSEYPRTVILNHGASETQVIYDSDDAPHTSKQYERKWRSRLGKNWRMVLDNKPEGKGWLQKELKRAKENGDL